MLCKCRCAEFRKLLIHTYLYDVSAFLCCCCFLYITVDIITSALFCRYRRSFLALFSSRSIKITLSCRRNCFLINQHICLCALCLCVPFRSISSPAHNITLLVSCLIVRVMICSDLLASALLFLTAFKSIVRPADTDA